MFVYADTHYYLGVRESLKGSEASLGVIQSHKYTIIPELEEESKDGEVLLGRSFEKREGKQKMFVYVGDYDEYAHEDNT